MSRIGNSSDESGDEGGPPIPDGDSCDESIIAQAFTTNFSLQTEEALSLKKCYILHIASNSDCNQIALGTSNKEVAVKDLTPTGFRANTIIPNDIGKTVIGVKYLNNDNNLLLYGDENGDISLYDFRTQSVVHTFNDTSSINKKQITSFDVNQNDRILCAGTDDTEGEVFLLFFDIRQRTLLGNYSDSHTDDVTQVVFHPSNPDLLSSGSTDGLINVFDISESNEDDALQYCLNTELGVQTLQWHKSLLNKDIISCITHTNVLQLFDVQESDMIHQFDRSNICNSIMRQNAEDCYLANCHNGADNEIFLLAGSNYDKGQCLRSVRIRDKSLQPLTNFVGNKQIIRTSLFNNTHNILLTGGEGGIVSLWSAGSTASEKIHLKEKTKRKSNVRPY